MHPAPSSSRCRWLAVLLLLAIVAGALGLRYRGVAWPALHPDEPTIAGWAHWTEEHPYISERFYAGGFFQLVKPFVALRTAVQEWRQSWQGFTGDLTPPLSERGSMIVFLRTVNVWLAAVTVLVFYALARRISGSRAGALAAAAFLAFSRLHVDHSHYAETDIAMLLTLSAALALWARWHDTGRLRWFLVAALASGWAIGTKFTLGALLLNLLAGAAAVRGHAAGWKRAGRVGVLVLAGMAACLAAVVYTNQGILNFGWLVPHVRSGFSSVYAERSGLLHHSAGDAAAVWISNWNTMRDGFDGIGWGWLAFMAIGLGMTLKPAYRRFWPITLLFAGLYAVYCIKLAPWIRGQEFMGFYPVFAVWLAIGVHEALGWAGRTRLPHLLRMAVGVAVVACGVGGAVQACRSASQFGYPDPRLQAMRWLYTHAPLDAVTAVENYTTPAERLFGRGEDIGQIEWTSHKRVDALNLDYLLRNATSRGRGSVDPRTRRLYPEYAANLADFEARADLLCGWGALGESPYAFAGHRMEWWQVRRESPKVAMVTPVFQPVLVEEGRLATVPACGCEVGSLAGIRVDGKPRDILVNGPAGDHRTLYVVLQTEERPAEVRIQFAGTGRSVRLGPYDAVAVPVRRPAWMPRFQEYDVVEVSARPVEHVKAIPCYAHVVPDLAGAAMLLLQKGYPNRALELLKAHGGLPDAPEVPWVAYVGAVDAGDWALADRLLSPARQCLESMEHVRTSRVAEVTVDGVNGATLQAHRRVRLPVGAYDEETGRWTVPPLQLPVARNEDYDRLYDAAWPLPVRLAKGRYTLSFTVSTPQRGPGEVPWELALGERGGPVLRTLALAGGARERVTLELEADRERDSVLRVTSTKAGGMLDLSEVELRWNGADLLRSERLELTAALVRHALQRGDRAGAEALLARAAEPGVLALQRLELEILSGDPARTREAAALARRILERAPAYAPALAVLAPGDAVLAGVWRKVDVATGKAVALYPWLTLTGMGTDPETGRRFVVFEAARDGVPAGLKVRAWRAKDRRNRQYFEGVVSERPLYMGERVRISVPPAPERNAYAGTWITVESPPFWLSASLPVPGGSKGRIPLE